MIHRRPATPQRVENKMEQISQSGSGFSTSPDPQLTLSVSSPRRPYLVWGEPCFWALCCCLTWERSRGGQERVQVLGETDPVSSNLAAQLCLSSLPSSLSGQSQTEPWGLPLS